VVLRVLPTEDVVLYDSCQASAVVSSCGRPWVDAEDKDAEEGGRGGGRIQMQRVLGGFHESRKAREHGSYKHEKR
jgi:hypothetical protein